MCGIVGYVGTKRQAYPILIKGLKRLEYRGYDSAGVALINPDGVLSVDKEKGKVADLERYCADKDTRGTIGIAHTRWATHGEPSARNAHPHYSQSRNLAIIHNGIIENYAEIKARLEEKGVRFRSDTDTEVLVQLIEYIQERKQSPLVVGIGEGEFFLGSDASPIIEFTDKVVYLEDGNIAVMKAGEELQIVNIYNEKLLPEVKTVDIDLGQIEKGGFPHFMLKEIFEQPECLENCMRGRINVDHNHVALSAVIDYRKELLAAKRIIIVACGTSWHAGLIGKQLIESFCRVPVDVEYASEFRYRNPVVGPGDVVIAISQSGETADTLAAVELARERGAFIYGVCNAVGASIPRATHTGSYIHVGPEIGVASTKAFTGQVTVLTLFALALGAVKGTVAREEYVRTIEELANIPDKIREVLKLSDQLAELARTFTYAHNFLYLGRGYNYPVALEGALKLKEISYIHAEGYSAAEMKHGPIALIDSDMPVVVVATHDAMYEKVRSNVQEIKAREGRVIAFVSKGEQDITRMADATIELPDTLECLEPLMATVPLQLLAYYIAVCKGKDVDQPRNLAKSVTVE